MNQEEHLFHVKPSDDRNSITSERDCERSGICSVTGHGVRYSAGNTFVLLCLTVSFV